MIVSGLCPWNLKSANVAAGQKLIIASSIIMLSQMSKRNGPYHLRLSLREIDISAILTLSLHPHHRYNLEI